MPHKFPHTYKVSVNNINNSIAELNTDSTSTIIGGPPPQFDGSGSEWSPEGLLISSIALCFVTTLSSLMAKKNDLRLKLENIVTEAQLDKTKDGLVFTKILLNAECSTDNEEQASAVLAKAKKYCIISNAIKCGTGLDITFV